MFKNYYIMIFLYEFENDKKKLNQDYRLNDLYLIT